MVPAVAGAKLATTGAMSIAPFPHIYDVKLSEASSLSAGPRTPIAIGAPPQFGGSDQVWGPEELLVGAVLSCVRTTFDAYAKGMRAVWRGTATGTLVKGRMGPEFSSIHVHVDLEVDAGNEERAKTLLERAERDCIITRTVKAPVELTMNIVVRPG